MRIGQLVFAAPGLVSLALFSCVCKPAPESPPTGQPGAPPPQTQPSEPAEPVPAPAGDRTPMIAPDNPHYSRVEGTTFENACQTDADCFTGGCSSEVCSATEGVSSTCIAPADGWPTAGGACGCVAGQCRWYGDATAPDEPTGTGSDNTETADETTEAAAVETGGQGQRCSEAGTCNDGLECVTYYGIAGAKGPKFTSCEIRCTSGKGGCPDGQSCVTIADGPGSVCR